MNKEAMITVEMRTFGSETNDYSKNPAAKMVYGKSFFENSLDYVDLTRVYSSSI